VNVKNRSNKFMAMGSVEEFVAV